MTDRDDERLGESDFATLSYGFPEPRTRVAFRPWHRPRKQFIRRDHWGAEIQHLLRSLPEGQELKYFGLPGEDLLDIKYVHDTLCVNSRRRLFFQGFDRSASEPFTAIDEADQNSDLAALLRSDLIASRSRIMRHDLELIGDEASVAKSDFEQYGPYDIVNLDLCGGLAAGGVALGGSLYGAVRRIFTVQERYPRPWLLLLTTRIDKENVEPSAREALLDIIEGDLRECEKFKHRCDQNLGHIMPPGEVVHHSDLVVLGLCQWLLALGESIKSSMTLAHYAAYRVVDPESSEKDMASLVLTCKPANKLAPSSTPLPMSAAPVVDRCKLAEGIPEVVARPLDVDALLRGDRPLYEKLSEETGELLGLIDVEPYKDWLRTREGGQGIS